MTYAILKHSILAAVAGVAIMTSSASTTQAAPLAPMSRGAYVDQESITEVRYRRHHNRGTALFGTALGLFALGAAGALANDYDDNYYAPYDGSYYPTYRYGYGYPGGGYYRGYRHPGYGAYRGHYPVNRQYYGSRQRGWEHHGWNR